MDELQMRPLSQHFERGSTSIEQLLHANKLYEELTGSIEKRVMARLAKNQAEKAASLLSPSSVELLSARANNKILGINPAFLFFILGAVWGIIFFNLYKDRFRLGL